MKLLTKEILKKFKTVGNQSNTKLEEQEIIVKFFNPSGAGSWYATEYNPETKIFFGWVSIFGNPDDDAGYFSLKQLEELKLPFNLSIERDKYFGAGRQLKEVMQTIIEKKEKGLYAIWDGANKSTTQKLQ